MATRKMVRWRLENLALSSGRGREPAIESIVVIDGQRMCCLEGRESKIVEECCWDNIGKINNDTN